MMQKENERRTGSPDPTSVRHEYIQPTQEHPKAKRVKLEHVERDINTDDDNDYANENRNPVDLESNAGR
jgi:hypothetical protein